jgi:hypothetical protein
MNPSITTCRGCGAAITPAPFCKHCGTDLRPLICATCGAENETGSRYCYDCGGSLLTKSQPPVQPGTPLLPPTQTSSTIDWSRPLSEQSLHFPNDLFPPPDPSWYADLAQPRRDEPAASIKMALLKTAAVMLGLIVSNAFMVGTAWTYMRRETDPTKTGIVWAVLVIVSLADLFILRAIRNQLGTGMAVATWLFGGIMLPISLFMSFRRQEKDVSVANSCMAAIAIPTLVAAFLGIQLAHSPKPVSGQIGAQSYVTSTPIPTPRIRQTPSPTPVLTPDPTETAVPRDVASFDVNGMAALLSRTVSSKDTPGTSDCEAYDWGTNEDGRYIAQFCDWGFVGYVVVESDKTALKWTLKGMDNNRYVIEDYPDYPAVYWRDQDGWINVAVAIGNVVVIASTGPEDKDLPHYEEIEGDMLAHADALAKHAVQRVLRLGGEPEADPGYYGSW